MEDKGHQAASVNDEVEQNTYFWDILSPLTLITLVIINYHCLILLFLHSKVTRNQIPHIQHASLNPFLISDDSVH